MGFHEDKAEGQNQLLRPAGHAPFDEAQGMVDFLGCKWTLMAAVQLFIHQKPMSLKDLYDIFLWIFLGFIFFNTAFPSVITRDSVQ